MIFWTTEAWRWLSVQATGYSPGIWGSVLCERKKCYSSSHHHYLRFFLWTYVFLYIGKATGVWPGHSTPSSAETGKDWSHTSTLSCFFMKWCLIKCMDFIFCPLNFLSLFADSLWPPIISTTPPAYSSLHLAFNLMTSNVNYGGRTAPLTSKVACYIFIQQI